jgi:hypothetical protein
MNKKKIVRNLIAIMAAAKNLNAEVEGKIDKKAGDIEITIFVGKLFPPRGKGIMNFTLKTLDVKGLKSKYLSNGVKK